MTRLDATSEPSMEDILASIRKIIAEDPPGSRPALSPSPAASQPAAQQPSLRAPERDRFSPFASRPADTAASTSRTSYSAPEPYLKASPQRPAEPEFGTAPFFSSTSAASSFAEAHPAASRVEPSFGPVSGAATPAVELSEEFAGPAARADSASVDAQLWDLLGETASVVIQPSTRVAPASASIAAAATGFGDRMAGRMGQSSLSNPIAYDAASTSQPQDARLDTRPGFTVSRDGFVAPSDETSSPPEADPFEFDLGPSPFQAKPDAPVATPASAPIGNSLTARMSASSLERITAPSVAATVAAGTIIDNHNAAMEGSDTAATAAVPPVSDEESSSTLADVAAPSVAATLAPKSLDIGASSEPIGRFIPANASVEPPKPVDRDVMEVVAPQRAAFDSAAIEVVRVAPEDDAQAPSASSSSTALALHHAEDQMRTMEETVAELLRPMLKSWLAENMPRIVERALRRELAEQMLLDKKDAAE